MMTRRYRIGGLLLWGAALAAAAAQPDVVLGPKAGKTPDDVPALLRALRAEDMGTRWNAALLLGEIGDVSAVPALLECVTGDTNTRVRRRAIEALGKLGDPAAVPGLAEALKDSDRFVRRDAAMALGVLGDQTAVPALIDALDDQEGFVRREAAYALGLLNDDRAIPALQAAARERPEAFSTEAPLSEADMSPVAREACFALGRLGGETAVPALAEVLRHHSYETRQRAIQALADLGKAGAAVLTTALEDDHPDVRQATIDALQEIGGSAGIAGLTEALQRCDEWERIAGIDFNQPATGTRRERQQWSADRSAFNGLLTARRDAIRALGELGDASVLPVLQAELVYCQQHENARVQGLAGVIRAAMRDIESRAGE